MGEAAKRRSGRAELLSGNPQKRGAIVVEGVGAIRQPLKRFKQWRRLEDDVKMLTESGGGPISRVLTGEEQERLLKAAEANPEWEHVWCAAQLAANTSMRGVEVKHVTQERGLFALRAGVLAG